MFLFCLGEKAVEQTETPYRRCYIYKQKYITTFGATIRNKKGGNSWLSYFKYWSFGHESEGYGFSCGTFLHNQKEIMVAQKDKEWTASLSNVNYISISPE